MYVCVHTFGLLRVGTHTQIGGRPYTPQEFGDDAVASKRTSGTVSMSI